MTGRLKITFVIETLAAGGAERVMANMANYWSGKGHAIEILTFWAQGSTSFYPLTEAVVHTPMSITRDSNGTMAFLSNNWQRVRTIRKAIDKSRPDIIISFMDRANML